MQPEDVTSKDPKNKVIVVDKNDNETGTCDKLKAHQFGFLHRAFSIILFNSKGEMLIHQRAAKKYHTPGLWSNACCSHPRPGKNLEDEVQERMLKEIGIYAPVRKEFSFIYKEQVGNGLIEHELDHVFVGMTDEQPMPNPEEVQDVRFIHPSELKQEMSDHPERFTPWFHKIMEKGRF
jgi:isopentenyl-diphosphate delta-isomerase, type 1